jgi:hypothetical protein
MRKTAFWLLMAIVAFPLVAEETQATPATPSFEIALMTPVPPENKSIIGCETCNGSVGDPICYLKGPGAYCTDLAHGHYTCQISIIWPICACSCLP